MSDHNEISPNSTDSPAPQANSTAPHATAHPIELRAPRGARLLEIDWSDGVTTLYRHRVLRAFCPCALCQGHDGPIEWSDGADKLPDQALEIEELKEVGQYALQLRWGDNHSTGIYSFRYLRELGGLYPLDDAEVRASTFGR